MEQDITELGANRGPPRLLSLILNQKTGFSSQKVYYLLFQITLYKITSMISSFLFLSTLMTFAILKGLYMKLVSPVQRKHHDDPILNALLLALPPRLNQNERRLVSRLAYYFEIHGLGLLEYKITTEDGFVLVLQRVIDHLEPEDVTFKRKPVLLLHGLLQSSGAYATSGPDNSIAFFLHKKGYDVWLGNNRCGFEPQHAYLDADDPNMWNWNINDMANYDLPAMVDHVLQSTGSGSKVALVAHSQGTTQTFLALLSKNIKRNNSSLNKKISCFVALSPAVFGGQLLRTKLFIRFMNTLPQPLFKYFFGIHSFMPIMMHMRSVLVGHRIFGFLSYAMFNFLFDWDDSLWDKRYRTRQFVFSPVYISSKLMLWWLNNKDGFINNSTTIFKSEERWFDADTPPIYLFIPEEDKLVDCGLLLRHFEKFETEIPRFHYKVLPKYSHLDVLWAKDVITTIGEPLLEFFQEVEEVESTLSI